MEKILAPSILAADIMRLGEQIEAVKNAGAKYLHIDVMDGMFVPALSYGMCVVESIRKSCDMVLDVHLMIVEPGRHVEAFAKAGADIITIHLEACADAHEVIRQIHSCGCKAGVSIKPGTPIEVLEEYLDEVELILIMSVEPGFGGQKYIPESTERIRQTAELIRKSGREIIWEAQRELACCRLQKRAEQEKVGRDPLRHDERLHALEQAEDADAPDHNEKRKMHLGGELRAERGDDRDA